MHELVMAPDSAKKQNPAFTPAYVLVAESATNILKAFNRTTAAADFLESKKELQTSENALQLIGPLRGRSTKKAKFPLHLFNCFIKPPNASVRAFD